MVPAAPPAALVLDSGAVDTPEGVKQPDPFWTVPTATTLTLADVKAAMEKIASAPPRICGVTEPHLFHPSALTVDGIHICANCAQPVPCRGGRVDWDWDGQT